MGTMCKGQRNYSDLTGMRSGRLVAIEPTHQRYHSYILWRCKCDCGNVTLVSSYNFKHGFKSSCGCLLREHATANFRKSSTQNLKMGTNLSKLRVGESIMHINNTSGFKGVSYSSTAKRYIASIGFMGKRFQRSFADKEDANAARKHMRILRDEFIEWWDSLDETQKNRYLSSKEESRNYFIEEFRKRIDQ